MLLGRSRQPARQLLNSRNHRARAGNYSRLARTPATRYGLTMTWVEACHDKSLQNLPYKVELNRQGQIIMSPTRNKHGIFQGRIACCLQTLLPHGEIIVECAIDTAEGTFVADVAWATLERLKVIEDEFSCSVAPQICVEVWSPSNTAEEIAMKRRLYLQKGAVEFWYCDNQGALTFFNCDGPLAQSVLCPEFPRQIENYPV
jgi:Uma2 family endonuclease